MNGFYEIYKLTAEGIRDQLIGKYSVLDGELNWSKDSRFTITGTCIGTAPVMLSDRIAIVRNGAQLFSGIVTGMNTECEDTAHEISTWEAEVSGDEVVLSWRYVFATGNYTTPANIEVGEKVYDKLPNDNNEHNTQSALNRMLYYIRKHIGGNAATVRRMVTVAENDNNSRGEQGRSAYHIKGLSKVLSEIGKSSELFCKVSTDVNGARILTIPDPRDRTSAMIVSPEFGNVSGWSKEEGYPKFNAVWVLSGVHEIKNEDDTVTQQRVWVYAEDTESIARYGRIENVVTKSDIKIVDADPDDPEVIPVTSAEVTVMLTEEAQKQLQEADATLKWTVTMAENNACAFMDDWQLGDKVRCVIDGQSFDSIIETVQIHYENGIETVTPTVGEVETGLYGKLFETLSGIDERLKTEEEN